MYFQVDDYNALKTALQLLSACLEDEHVSQETLYDCKLVADELLSNVLRHGGGTAYFSAELGGELLTITVKSSHTFCPPKESILVGVESEGGRGLYLVDSIVEQRVYSQEMGTRVVIRIKK